MKPHLLAILLLLVSLPLGLYAWLEFERARGEQVRAREQVLSVLADRLRDIDGQISRTAQEAERELDSVLEQILGRAGMAIADASRQHPLIDQAFTLDREGQFVFPSRTSTSSHHLEFFERTQHVWNSGAQLGRPPGDNASLDEQTGWYTWFWGGGLQYIYWMRQRDGTLIGFEINRTALMAHAIGDLPADAGETAALESGKVALTGATGDTLYQWGSYEPPSDAAPTMTHPVCAPFESWGLAYFSPPLTDALPPTRFGVWASLAALGITLAALGIYFYRESTREIRLASQRVSFVNQVSHELKTPLTNIRMYAELADSKLPEDAADASEYLSVVVSESARLSRMIQNVLTFSKHQRGVLTVNRSTKVLDQVIRDVVDHFRPSLDEKGVEVELDLRASERGSLDADVCEQILGNLISNVEKYAADGKHLSIRSAQESGKARVVIADSGPGVPPTVREKIFDPFFRISNKLSDGVSGTGLGLGISRSLARLHGGDLVLLESDEGTRFELTLQTS